MGEVDLVPLVRAHLLLDGVRQADQHLAILLRRQAHPGPQRFGICTLPGHPLGGEAILLAQEGVIDERERELARLAADRQDVVPATDLGDLHHHLAGDVRVREGQALENVTEGPALAGPAAHVAQPQEGAEGIVGVLGVGAVKQDFGLGRLAAHGRGLGEEIETGGMGREVGGGTVGGEAKVGASTVGTGGCASESHGGGVP